jgi:hypothetical protein
MTIVSNPRRTSLIFCITTCPVEEERRKYKLALIPKLLPGYFIHPTGTYFSGISFLPLIDTINITLSIHRLISALEKFDAAWILHGMRAAVGGSGPRSSA